MARIGLVTDSTADLEPAYYAAHDVTMVPLTVRFGEEAHLDWVQIRPDEFYSRLRASDELPKTSQPSASQFIDAYEKLSESCDSIISIHLSAALSGTVEAAHVAAGQVRVPVTVIDTKLASLGIALVLADAVEARQAGVDHEELVARIQRRCEGVTTLFYVETLRYLQLGGRIGKASALVGSLLQIRPILKLGRDGLVAPFKKVKGTQRVYSELVEAVRSRCEAGVAKMGLVHASNPEAIENLKRMLSDAGVRFDVVFESSIGSVIGTYIGPGAFGAIFYVDSSS